MQSDSIHQLGVQSRNSATSQQFYFFFLWYHKGTLKYSLFYCQILVEHEAAGKEGSIIVHLARIQ